MQRKILTIKTLRFFERYLFHRMILRRKNRNKTHPPLLVCQIERVDSTVEKRILCRLTNGWHRDPWVGRWMAQAQAQAQDRNFLWGNLPKKILHQSLVLQFLSWNIIWNAKNAKKNATRKMCEAITQTNHKKPRF